jgi:hypothetical protein
MGKEQRGDLQVTVIEDAQVIAGALAAGFRSDDDGVVDLLRLLDRNPARVLAGLLDIDTTLLRTVTQNRSANVESIVEELAGLLDATKEDRRVSGDGWGPEVWDAAVIALRCLSDAMTGRLTTRITKPDAVALKAWLTGWYVVAWALTIELAKQEGMSPEEMAQSIALDYANWTAS